eukprot:TRINITY_DN63209_c0_g1_i1.p2 TRINITY_DN63209_c0_g1~~TRINITY_DN63209_c0_g1_i1.p2  ORF type:complete len:108 (+),score=37.17 TRINITY_DN63209_c0_g1_i1:298-621(+)
MKQHDSWTVAMALDALERILVVGKDEAEKAGQNNSPFLDMIHAVEPEGIDTIERLQLHPEQAIHAKASYIISVYNGFEEDDTSTIPQVEAAQYIEPKGGFNIAKPPQ